MPAAVVGAVAIAGVRAVRAPVLPISLGNNIAAIMPLLFTGPLLVLNLYFYPGGTAEIGFALRDQFLRWVARAPGHPVPSLVADRRVETRPRRRAAS